MNQREELMEMHELKEQFSRLLMKEEKEQKYQEFLEEHPYFIPREFVQNHGIHLDVVFRKLSLAKDYITDFFYLSKSSDDWNCVLIEIEKPQSKYFKNGSNEFHQDFIAGISQIRRWRAWFEESTNKESFINNTLRTIRAPPAMSRNPCFIKYVLVHGRREEYHDNHIRSGLVRAEERDDFKIMSFDSLMESLKSKGDLYVAVKTNDYVDIISDRFINEGLFSLVSPSAIRITDALKKDAICKKLTWHHRKFIDGNEVLTLDYVLPKIKIKG